MTIRPVFLATLLACTVSPHALSLAQDTGAPGRKTHTSPSNRVGLQALVDCFSQAVNTKDAKALAACFTEDGEFTNPIGMTAKGRIAIENFHAGLFAPVRQPNTPGLAESLRTEGCEYRSALPH